ncbi:YlxR family protein [Yimella sp. cx-51]|uniref:YlxR family protein n=1 Tax=Yimella sp. cx-51 TaxID=2770551 RepID=UPI00165D4C30|nr:YlxR family protein [Yimella sp. cx-51]MBC9956844.1 YlxR family protein [Yimella sp. cx-51]QTH39070.1 YlxR family protein [Yimella sp. cx-51]
MTRKSRESGSGTKLGKESHALKRTCVGCRTRDEPSALVRVVAIARSDQPSRWQVVVDERRDLPGRGAWVHASGQCLERAIVRRAFGRALRLSVPVDTSLLEQWRDQQDPESPTGDEGLEKNRKRV